MLRRRIFSSAMASVMALSSIAVVANAEDMANHVKSKDDLATLIAPYDDAWQLTKAEQEYAEKDLELLNDALAYAEAVLAATDASAADYTVAWRMVYACSLKKKAQETICHTLQDVKDILADAKEIIDTNNIYQVEIMDRYYTADTFQALRNAYDIVKMNWQYHIDIGLGTNPPEGYVESLDAKEIDGAYHTVAKAIADLKPLDHVTKSQFVAAIKTYQELLTKEFAYEDWRRPVNWGANNQFITYGDAFDALSAADDAYLITENYEELIGYKNITDTTKEDIVIAYQDCLKAIDAFNAWKADSVSATTKIAVLRLMNTYSKQFAYAAMEMAGQTSCEDLYDLIVETVGEDNVTTTTFEWKVAKDSTGKIGSNMATILLKGDADVFVPLDKDGKWTGGELSLDNVDVKDYAEGVEGYQRISGTIEFDLAGLIKADFGETAAMFEACNGNTEEENPALAYAYWLATEYVNGNFGIEDDIDTKAVVKVDGVAEGAPKEWDVVYRYLQYAITDHFCNQGFSETTATGEFHNRAQILSLLEKCYDLIEETAHAPIFSAANKALVDECERVQEWLAETYSDKDYKDYNAGTAADGDIYEASTVVYHWLSDCATKNGAYDQLLREYEALKIEYKDVYDLIAKVSAQIDADEITCDDKLEAALNDAAYWLNAIDDVLYYTDKATGEIAKYYDNAAFNDLRDKFLGTNRVITNQKYDAATYIMTLEGSIYAYVGTVNGTKYDLNNEHYYLYNAYNTLTNTAAGNVKPEYAQGDVNRDGSVNVLDASAILQHIAKIQELDAEQLTLAELDGNAGITVMDASEILKIAKANA